MSLEQRTVKAKRHHPVTFSFTTAEERHRHELAEEAVYVIREWQATIEKTRPVTTRLVRRSMEKCAVADALAVLAGNRW